MITKQRTCKARDPETNVRCNNKFSPDRPFVKWCSPLCGVHIHAEIKAKKSAKSASEQRIAHRAAKERIKTRNDFIRETQQACNAFIRRRDQGKPCISCGKPTKSGDHAGHWKPTSTSPELRFNELNVHLQCVQCNLFLHGNVANYRAGLICRIGLESVEWLEGIHAPAKWGIDDLKRMKAEFKVKEKGLKNDKRATS